MQLQNVKRLSRGKTKFAGRSKAVRPGEELRDLRWVMPVESEWLALQAYLTLTSKRGDAHRLACMRGAVKAACDVVAKRRSKPIFSAERQKESFGTFKRDSDSHEGRRRFRQHS